MNILKKSSDGKYELVEVGVANAVTSSIVSPLILSPVTGPQALIFGTVTMVAGAVLGVVFSNKIPGLRTLAKNNLKRDDEDEYEA